MPRVEQINVNKLNYEKVANAQEEDQKLKGLMEGPNNLKFSKITFPDSKNALISETSTTPVTHRKQVFNIIFGLTDPGIKATTKMIKTKFVWAKMLRFGQRTVSFASY